MDAILHGRVVLYVAATDVGIMDYPGTLAVVFFVSLVMGRVQLVVARLLRAAYEKRGKAMG